MKHTAFLALVTVAVSSLTACVSPDPTPTPTSGYPTTGYITDPNTGHRYDLSLGYNDPVALAGAVKLMGNESAKAKGLPSLIDVSCARSSGQTFVCHLATTKESSDVSILVSDDGQTYRPLND